MAVLNFWDSGARRDKPDFGEGCPYKEQDWDRYVRIRDGRENGISVAKRTENDSFSFANKGADGSVGGDGLHILAPNETLLNDPDLCDDINEGSYVLLYRSIGGDVLLCGDAHDAAFEHIKKKHAEKVASVSVMLAPHHGRDSGRSYDFLDFIRPKLTIIGCAPSKHIDYAQWNRRGLATLTSNQAGNIVLEITDGGIDVFVENKNYAQAVNEGAALATNAQGYFRVRQIPKA